MKKRMGTILLTGMLCVSGGGVVYGATGGEGEGYVLTQATPRFANIQRIEYRFSTKGGEAVYSAKVTARSATKIKIYLELQKKEGAKWTEVQSSSDYENGRTFMYEDRMKVSDGMTYRVYYKITAYYGDGESETVTEYKY